MMNASDHRSGIGRAKKPVRDVFGALLFGVLLLVAPAAKADDPQSAPGGVLAKLRAMDRSSAKSAPYGGVAEASDAVSRLRAYIGGLGGDAGSLDKARSRPDDLLHATLRAPDDLHHAVLRAPDDSNHAALRDLQTASAPDSARGSAPDNDQADEAVANLLKYSEQLSGTRIQLAQAVKPSPARMAQPKLPVGEAIYIGSQACMQCHSPIAAEFAKTVMGRIAKVQKGKLECESCHGPGSLHVKAGGGRGVGGIIAFRKDSPTPVEERNAVCTGCHLKGAHLNWQGSTHETRGVACSDCHAVKKHFKKNLARAVEMEVCGQCHQNKRAQMFRSGHMPIREGKMTCSNCHNPHGSFSESLLKTATANDTCYTCHAEKRGPFLWEHPPVRENCVNCHDPHGTVNDFMLKVSRPRLCQQCHSALAGHAANPRNPGSVFAFNRECQNCHSQHHGSNSPSGARFQR